jgi:hypothetical protein
VKSRNELVSQLSSPLFRHSREFLFRNSHPDFYERRTTKSNAQGDMTRTSDSSFLNRMALTPRLSAIISLFISFSFGRKEGHSRGEQLRAEDQEVSLSSHHHLASRFQHHKKS